jgi:hypothetical protein
MILSNKNGLTSVSRFYFRVSISFMSPQKYLQEAAKIP